MSQREVKETILARGHENILAVHPSTLMITKEKHLTKTGDCIIAVAADKGPSDLSSQFKEKLRQQDAKLTIIIEVDGNSEKIDASGSPLLTLTGGEDLVIRKSEYMSERTLAIRADKSSNDISRKFVEKLKNPKAQIKINLIVS